MVLEPAQEEYPDLSAQEFLAVYSIKGSSDNCCIAWLDLKLFILMINNGRRSSCLIKVGISLVLKPQRVNFPLMPIGVEFLMTR